MSHDSALAPLRDELDARRAQLHKMAAAIEAVTTLLDSAASNGFAARVERVNGTGLRIAIDLAAGSDAATVSELPSAGVDLIPTPFRIDDVAIESSFVAARDDFETSARPVGEVSRPEPAPLQNSDRGWSDKEVAELRAMRADGEQHADIASALDRSELAVKSKLKALSMAAAAGPAPAKDKPKAWTKDEDDKAVEMYRDGATVAAIAAALGRPVPGTTFRLRKLRDRLNMPKRVTSAKPASKAPVAPPRPPLAGPVSSAPPPATAQAEPLKTAVPCKSPDMRGLTIAQRAVAVRLAALPFSDWTLDDDLDLVEAIVRGTKVDTVSAELERDKADCLARWKLLCPKPAPEAQADLMAVLRRRVTDARAGA